MMEYKTNLYGRIFLTVSPKNTKQMCSNCGFVMGKKGLNTEKVASTCREWTCPNCHNFHIRDWNASINILAKGLEKLAKKEAYLLLNFQSVDNQ